MTSATSPYADVTATSPDLLVPLKYASTSADGQILFTDAACTVPVTTIGDPVGGVKYDGVIVATQSTDARRPVWQGESNATQFSSASSQFVDHVGAAADFAYLNDPSGAAIAFAAKFDDLATRSGVISTFDGTKGVAVEMQSGGDLRFAVDDMTVFEEVLFAGAVPDTAWHSYVVAYDDTETVLYVDGLSAATKGANPSLFVGDPDLAPRIGRFFSVYMHGSIEVITGYSRKLTASEASDFHAGASLP